MWTHTHTHLLHYGDAFLNNANLPHAHTVCEHWTVESCHSRVFLHKLMNHVIVCLSSYACMCARTHGHTDGCLKKPLFLSCCDWSRLSIISWLINWYSGSPARLITSAWKAFYVSAAWLRRLKPVNVHTHTNTHTVSNNQSLDALLRPFRTEEEDPVLI